MKRWAVLLIIGGFFLFAFLPAGWAGGDAGKGKASYEKLCAACHGISGKGDGPAAGKLKVKPKDQTDKSSMSQLADENLFEVTKRGGVAVKKSPLMPPFGKTLKDDQIWDLVAYMRTLSK